MNWILVILLIISHAQDNIGQLSINSTFTLVTNITDQAPSVIIKFMLPNEHTSLIGCFVSNLDLEGQKFEIDQLKFSKQNYIAYDLHGIQSNSNTQLIGFNYYNTLYLLCQSSSEGNVRYELTYKEDFYSTGCINQCQGYNTTSSLSQAHCSGDYCECQVNQLGYFCQLKATYILSGIQTPITLRPQEWTYYYYQFMQTNIILQSDVQDQTVFYSVTLRNLPQLEVPNRSQAFILTNATDISGLTTSLLLNSDSNILYIGLLNSGNTQKTFNFTLLAGGQVDEGALQRNKIIIIVVGSVIGALLILTFILSVLKAKKLQATATVIVRDQVRIKEKQQKGFPPKFIKDYFGIVSYKKLVELYPGLQQFDDCVICLESIKNGKTKQQRHCSVTPCFHVFHQKCLSSWLEKQRNCPFCRAEYEKVYIQSKYPWLELKQQRVNKSDTTYITKLKQNAITDTSSEQLNESQQELVAKLGGNQEA